MYRVCTYFFYINIKKEGKNKKERTLNTNVKKKCTRNVIYDLPWTGVNNIVDVNS